jgi:probable rRNA maturation factor
MPVSVDIDRKAWRGLAAPERLTRTAVSAALKTVGLDARRALLSVVLTDDATVRGLNRRWRRLDRPTNVLSFPQRPPPRSSTLRLLGDVVLAGGVVDREAREQKKTLAEHAAHLIIHGVLHLLGHDHHRRSDATRMERLEIEALAALGIADPYRRSLRGSKRR